jgi:hypothetical protein
MDPNANLQEQREIVARIEAYRYMNDTPIERDGYRLSELVIALDEWISKGGFLPDAWRR